MSNYQNNAGIYRIDVYVMKLINTQCSEMNYYLQL